jgi:hypothetical protein
MDYKLTFRRRIGVELVSHILQLWPMLMYHQSNAYEYAVRHQATLHHAASATDTLQGSCEHQRYLVDSLAGQQKALTILL